MPNKKASKTQTETPITPIKGFHRLMPNKKASKTQTETQTIIKQKRELEKQFKTQANTQKPITLKQDSNRNSNDSNQKLPQTHAKPKTQAGRKQRLE